MESTTTVSPFLTPGIIVPGAIAFIGFVAWLIRLEAKVNGQAKSVLKLEDHADNDEIHFNAKVAQEIEKRHMEWRQRVENDVKEIKTMIKEIAGK